VERFTQKLGPLPVWAWAAIGVLALVGYMYFTKTGFFGSGSAGAGPTAAADNSLGSLLGNLARPNPTAHIAPEARTDNPATAPAFTDTYGPSLIAYDNSAGTDRGSSVMPPGPAPTAQPLTVQLFAPIAAQLGGLLPGILTPAPPPPPAPIPVPYQAPRSHPNSGALA
jgi:hypothetical protein